MREDRWPETILVMFLPLSRYKIRPSHSCGGEVPWTTTKLHRARRAQDRTESRDGCAPYNPFILRGQPQGVSWTEMMARYFLPTQRWFGNLWHPIADGFERQHLYQHPLGQVL